MNPVAFRIFGLEIRWYGLLMATGMLLASLLLLHFAKKKGYSEDSIYDLILVIIPSGIVGARLYYVVFNWGYYSQNLWRIVNLREGGLAIHGGVIAGVISGYIYCKSKNMDFFDVADMVAPGLVLAQAIGRWGNFANSEAHGGPTDLPWAIEVGGEMVHPTFLYESIWNILIFFFLMWRYRNKEFNGELFLLYGILYSVGRYFIEGLRTDSLMIGGFRTAQVVSVSVILIFTALWLHMRKRNKRLKDEG
ncbi:MAG: prolipoprotein diacylglyceryl transferase [Tissierellia bacterium]|nr:prolipoprotein diacylglyceryl transferase [Bacillota bacterium]NLL23330.1 prolipoprotein diacylglyceryl transferase [Tissierellia bacterium]